MLPGQKKTPFQDTADPPGLAMVNGLEEPNFWIFSPNII
jgi:hypothetical protein